MFFRETSLDDHAKGVHYAQVHNHPSSFLLPHLALVSNICIPFGLIPVSLIAITTNRLSHPHNNLGWIWEGHYLHLQEPVHHTDLLGDGGKVSKQQDLPVL